MPNPTVDLVSEPIEPKDHAEIKERKSRRRVTFDGPEESEVIAEEKAEL